MWYVMPYILSADDTGCKFRLNLKKMREFSDRPLTAPGPDAFGKESHRHFPQEFCFLKKKRL